MDFETLFYLAIFAIYILYQVLAGNKKRQARKPGAGLPPQPASDAPGRPAATTAEPTLDDALREIRLALGMEAPPAPPPEPRAVPAPRQPAPPPQEFRPFPNHFADADFEARPTAFGPAASLHKKETPRPAARPTPAPRRVRTAPKPAKPEPTQTRGVRTEDVLQRLRGPEAREAFVLSEIFGLPRALRRH